MAKALTYAEIKDRISKSRDSDYILITKEDKASPILSRTPIRVKHVPCGSVIETRFQSFVNDGKGKCHLCSPPVCSDPTKLVTEDEFKKRLITNFGNDVILVSGFTRMKIKCLVKHTVCGSEYMALPKELVRPNATTGCKFCSNRNRGRHQIPDNYLENILESGYRWLDTYKGGNKLLHKIVHVECGTEYTVRPNDFQQGYRCPVCSVGIAPKESRNAKRIRNILEELGIEFKLEYSDKRCKSDKGGQLRFDFALEHLDNKLIVIEYDGEFHDNSGYFENSNTSLRKKIYTETARRDAIKDKFVADHPEDYVAIHRITHKDPLKKTLMSILELYFEL